MLVKDVFSRDVIDEMGMKVGKISDMEVDMTKGTIQHVVISMGLFKKKEMKLDKIKNIGDTIILNIKKDNL